MGLGTTGLENFMPKRSGTAESIINAVSHEKHKKSVQLQIRIDEDVYVLFREICDADGTDISKAIRAYIGAVITRGSL